MSANQRIAPFLMRRAISVTYEPEYQAVLDRASFLGYTLPDSSTNDRNNLRVKNLKDVGLWSLLDLFYIFDNPSGLADFSKLNYINPSSFKLFNSNPALEPSFIADFGFKGDGSMYFSTGYNALSDSVHFDDANRSTVFGFKGFDFLNDTSIQAIFGCRVSNNTKQIFVSKTSTGFLNRIGSTVGEVVGFDRANYNKSVICSKLTGSSSIYVDGTYVVDGSGSTSSNFDSLVLYLMAMNLNGTASGMMTAGLSYFYIGGNIGIGTPNTNSQNFHSIMNDTYTP